MAQCRGCGTQLPDGARFCLECGRPLASTCTGCNAALPPQAKFCMECGTPAAAGSGASPPLPPPEPTGASSRRTTSILFGDLVGFTTLSESRDAEDVRELLGRYFDECRQIVARYGGVVEKFIGDAVMAVWGVPTSHEDDAERAVRAGLELVAAVNDFGRDVGAPDLALRVGVVTGEVAVTTGATQQGMVAGDAVNTAARVQGAATPGSVFVDETTRLLTTAAITYADAGSHALKGKADPVPLWSVRAVVAAVGGAQRADGLEAPLVGRDRELRLVKELFHQAEESGRPTLLVVDGDPGVGKTRLAWEFEKYVDGLNDLVRWHSGRCVAYGEGVAYFALAEAVRGRLQTGSASEDASTEELLEHALAEHVDHAEERAWLRGRLAALLGTGTGSGTSTGSGTGSAMTTYAREDLFSAWTVFLERIAGDQPLTLVVDDAQHADDGLLAFLEHLVTVATFPCFVVLLTRPGLLERAGTLAAHRRTNLLRLATLTDPDMARLLDGLVSGLPDDVRDQLVARSDGIPVFAVETVRSLIDRDLVVPRGGQYVLADDAPLDLDSLAAPASLQALIAARLDALTPDQRRVVDRASVLGTSFTLEALNALCPEVDDVGAVLTQLQRVQILAHDGNRMNATYGQHSFVQSAVRQVAYGVLSRRDRKAVHLAVVAHFESAGETGDDTAAMRAQHYLDALEAVPGDHDEADLRAAAVDNLVRAAARSTGLGSHFEAARHLAAAVPLVDDDHRRADVLLRAAQSEFNAALWEAAAEHALEAEQQFVALGERGSAGLAVGLRGRILIVGFRQREEAAQLVQPWWEELREAEDAVEARLVLSGVMFGTGVHGDPGEALAIAHERLLLAEEHEDTVAVITTLNSMSVFYSDRGLMTLSGSVLRTASELARSTHDLASESHTLLNLAAEANPSDVASALSYCARGLEVVLRAGIRTNLDILVGNLLIGQWHAGEWDAMDAPMGEVESRLGPLSEEMSVGVRAMRARARGDDLPPLVERLNSEGGDAPAFNAWIEVVRAMPQAREAADFVAPAVSAARAFLAETGLWDDLAFVYGHALTCALEAADVAALRELLALVDDARRLPRALRGHRDLTRAQLAAHDGDERAGERFASAIEHYEAFGSPVFVAHARRRQAEWLDAQGRAEEATPLRAAARATYERLGASAWLTDLDRCSPTRQQTSLRP